MRKLCQVDWQIFASDSENIYASFLRIVYMKSGFLRQVTNCVVASGTAVEYCHVVRVDLLQNTLLSHVTALLAACEFHYS